MKLIWRATKEVIGTNYWLGMLLLYVMLIGSKYFSNFVTQHIIANNCEFYHYVALASQIMIPISIYLVLILSIQKVAASLFSKLRQKIDY